MFSFACQYCAKTKEIRLEGTYKLIENSDGDYISMNSENEYEVTIINNGIKQNKTFTNPNIIYIENENDARIEINKGNWSMEYIIYIPFISQSNGGDDK